MAMKYCSPFCNELVDRGKCPKHAKDADIRRGTASQRGYCSSRWRHLRKEKLDDQPWCSVCAKIGVTEIATEVDHIIAHAGQDDPLFWEWTNLDSKCKPCHSAKTVKHDGGFGRRRRREKVSA